MNRNGSNILRVASNPGRGTLNPYIDLFYDALEPHGVKLVGDAEVSGRWLLRHRKEMDAIHLHWLQVGRHTPLRFQKLLPVPRFWQNRVVNSSFAPVELFAFWRYLRLAQQLGIRLIWTLHNLEPHENAGRIDHLVHALLARNCDLIICHSAWARQVWLQRYRPSGQVVVMPHGNYDGAYPLPRSCEKVRRELGLDPQRPLVSCVGGLRHYKGLDLACDAVQRLQGSVQFLVAGAAHDRPGLAALENRIRHIPGALLVVRRLSAQEFSDFTAASDAILLPYRQITGSGLLLAALTLARGVIASDLPYFREVLGGEPSAGMLFPVGDADALAAAIWRYLGIPGDKRQAAARALAESFPWEKVVQPVAEVMKSWTGAGYQEVVLRLTDRDSTNV